ncbi:MAG: hypothetical protein A2Y00_04955 [Omnitrophica WOR_2 bacterium GWF2_43_52]|nr:MAG: hypothetical protein A2062_07270 [Omnitrophica WOR_2 bacterium GWA2_44_7]OGX17518.1 MAG: hypothetical protein A2Y01_01785 [Omnitrophica WOR_2 bacterium GWC2_44_8]OGX20456.1 MAG: hypothetical protein A2Y00_04955 [Omnitrophica WOR_2 bacterium GWF2_43_52]OGX53028.1 MAG: hypothetical protein A2460_06455 [Omnitrophica WOR_2 bacterium RIFOXYC2_FULL_43_9]HAH20510.1 hypothetical protein [Candidatus Omnitrophota bacterium]
MDEKRKYRRTPAREKAFLKCKENNSHEGELMDVSSGGLRMLSADKVKVGSTLTGKFKIMPQMGSFYISGEVIWVKPMASESNQAVYEVGIKFNKVSTIPSE